MGITLDSQSVTQRRLFAGMPRHVQAVYEEAQARFSQRIKQAEQPATEQETEKAQKAAAISVNAGYLASKVTPEQACRNIVAAHEKIEAKRQEVSNALADALAQARKARR